MKYHLLGKSGLRVSELCLGTMTFGTEFGWGSSKEESRKIFDRFVEAGGNFIDTANYYTRGTSETYLGEFIQKERERLVLATKYSISTNPEDPNAGGNHRKNMRQAVEASLKRLGTDFIDLYWVHIWDFTTPIDEVLRGLEDLVRAGKILHIGLSDTPSWIVARGNTLAELRGWSSFVGVQLEYSLIERTIEREYFSLCKEMNLPILAWSPLGMGVLTGKYLEKTKEEYRFGVNEKWGEKYLTDRNQKIAQTVVDIAKELNASPAQVALRWACQRPGTVIPIIGGSRESQIVDNLGAAEITLSDSQMQRLNEVSEIEMGFPTRFLQDPNIRRMLLGEKLDSIC